MANPTLLDMPIARDGNKNAIPTTDNGTTGLLSQQYGWQLINAIPPQQGGKAVKREDFNGALYLLSNLLFYLQKGWQFEWNSNQTYYAGCVVKDTSDGKMYMCLNDVTSTTAPHSDTTNWKLWDLSMIANYLPLTGGTMLGAPKIFTSTNDGALMLNGGPSNNYGTYIQLDAKDHEPNNGPNVTIGAISDQDDTLYAVQLNGRTGKLKVGVWGGTFNDLGGSAIVAKFFGESGYIKYVSGLTRQWFNVVVANIPANGTLAQTLTFQLAFSSVPFVVQATIRGIGTEHSSQHSVYIDAVTENRCDIHVYNGATVAQSIAISVLVEGV